MNNGADVLVDGPLRLGFRHLFGMPGSHSTTLYDAIRRQGRLPQSSTRNEQAGAFAADGYARVTGKPGLVCTTAGPGATNALTGVCRVLGRLGADPPARRAGERRPHRSGMCAYHEIDLESIFRPVTKWCGTVRKLEDIPTMLGQAFEAMTRGRPRPTALFLPQDLMREASPLNESVVAPSVPADLPESIPPSRSPRPWPCSRRPSGPSFSPAVEPLWADAAVEVRALAERLGAPVITSLNGKGILDERDPVALGHARSVRAKAVLPHADAMLAIGCRFTEVMTEWRRMPVPKNLVQIDVDPGQIGMNHPVAVGIEADAKAALQALLRDLSQVRTSGWDPYWEQARTTRPARPEWLIETLRAALPETTPVFTDACEMGYRLQTDWTSYGPRSFFYPSNYITLGWGFPAALGAAVARGGEPVVSVSGDGGFLMTAQELATASRYQLPLIAIVHNDSSYGAIKNIQNRLHEGRFLDVELNNPDFLKFAEAFAIPSARATDASTLKAAVAAALERQGPTLIEVPDRWRSIRP